MRDTRFNSSLNFSWLDVALEGLISIQEAELKRNMIRNISREIVAICRQKRDRVKKVEKFLDEFGEYIPKDKKQEIFRLIAEVLMFINHNGIRIKFNDDPSKILLTSMDKKAITER